MKPYYDHGDITLHHGDCLEVMAGMPENSVDAIITDPPYFKVKNEHWDRQWDNPAEFLLWLDSLCGQWYRLLRPNGSLFVFASPKMSARVECTIGARFNVLNRITWEKDAGWHRGASKEILRAFFSASESIIFAEHMGADNIAKGEAGYVAKCDELRGFVFEPLRAYLAEERTRAGWTTWQVAEDFQRKTGSSTVTGMARHWFRRAQWALPTEANYDWLRQLFNSRNGGEYLRREYEYLRREYEDLRREYEYLRREYEYLRREYEDLRREYEELRRPFSVSADEQYTDVWTFDTVNHYPGKHPCEKPVDMMRHIVKCSTKPGGIVLDPFMGSGSTGVAALREGRQFIGIELNPDYLAIARERIINDGPLLHWSEEACSTP